MLTRSETPTLVAIDDRRHERRWFWGTLLAVAILRCMILCVGLVSIHQAPRDTTPQLQLDHPWIAWDAADYYQVARDGYAVTQDGFLFEHIAYFPLVPLAARLLAPIMPLGFALVCISNLCSLVGFAFCLDWAHRLTSLRTATICVMLIATFPGTVTFAAGATEGPFFMLVAITLWLLAQKRLLAAACVCGVAAGTRPTGVALAICLTLYTWSLLDATPLVRRLMIVGGLGLISCSGLFAYELFLWQRFHSPTIYLHAQSIWTTLDHQRVMQDLSHGLVRYSWAFFKQRITQPQSWNRVLGLVILIVNLIGLYRPGPIPRSLLLLPLLIFAMTALPGHGLRISSIGRYESVAPPLFLLVSLWLTGKEQRLLMIGLISLLMIIQLRYAILFPRQIWVG